MASGLAETGQLDPAIHRPHRRFACAQNQVAPQASTRRPLAGCTRPGWSGEFRCLEVRGVAVSGGFRLVAGASILTMDAVALPFISDVQRPVLRPSALAVLVLDSCHQGSKWTFTSCSVPMSGAPVLAVRAMLVRAPLARDLRVAVRGSARCE